MAKIEKAPKCPCCGGSVTANATITVRLYPSQVQLLDELVAAAPNDERGNRHNRSTFMRQILNQYINEQGKDHG